MLYRKIIPQYKSFLTLLIFPINSTTTARLHLPISSKVKSINTQHLNHYYTLNLVAMTSKKTIKDYGYAFNNDGQLRKLEEGKPGDQPFQFNISDNHHECQKHYEELGDAVTEYVYHLLEDQEKLIKLPVPEGATEENGTFIFVSKDYDKKDNLLILIHGSGVVRAGQWARSLIINDSINKGTQIPYIRRGVANGYGIVILNTNDNYQNNEKIELSDSPEEHAIYVWKNYISNASASNIAIVAHSYGGVVTLVLAQEMRKDFERRVRAIAFTDSVHGFSNAKVSDHLKEVARNWVSSSSLLDSPVKTPEDDVTRVSAGHPKHEMTSYSCIDSVFKFIGERMK